MISYFYLISIELTAIKYLPNGVFVLGCTRDKRNKKRPTTSTIRKRRQSKTSSLNIETNKTDLLFRFTVNRFLHALPPPSICDHTTSYDVGKSANGWSHAIGTISLQRFKPESKRGFPVLPNLSSCSRKR